MAVPTRSTSEAQLDAWNQAFRASPLYQNFLKKNGLTDTGRGVTLSRAQQSALERELASAGMKVPDGMHIDQGGNLNQENKLWRNVGIGAAIGGGALTGFGLAGMGPLAGLGGGGAAAGGAGAAGAGAGTAASGTLAASSLPTSPAMNAVPASIASQGVSAGMGLGAAGAGASALGSGVTAGATGAGGSMLGKIGRGIGNELSDPSNLASLAAVIGGLIAGRGNDQDSEEARRIQQITETQMRRADPLHQVAVNLAFGRAPTQYRQGVTMNNLPLPEYDYGSS